jgi:hypothetical protein
MGKFKTQPACLNSVDGTLIASVVILPRSATVRMLAAKASLAPTGSTGSDGAKCDRPDASRERSRHSPCAVRPFRLARRRHALISRGALAGHFL